MQVSQARACACHGFGVKGHKGVVPFLGSVGLSGQKIVDQHGKRSLKIEGALAQSARNQLNGEVWGNFSSPMKDPMKGYLMLMYLELCNSGGQWRNHKYLFIWRNSCHAWNRMLAGGRMGKSKRSLNLPMMRGSSLPPLRHKSQGQISETRAAVSVPSSRRLHHLD